MLSEKPVTFKTVGRWVVGPAETYTISMYTVSWPLPPVALSALDCCVLLGLGVTHGGEMVARSEQRAGEGRWSVSMPKPRVQVFSPQIQKWMEEVRAQVIRNKIYFLVDTIPSIRDLFIPCCRNIVIS